MLVIIPGWRHDAAQWSVVSNLLAHQGVEHAVLDIPGFGTIPYNPDLQTLADLSAWCLTQIAALQSSSLTPLVLCGHSCGGRIGLKLIAEGLDVQQLILIGSPNLYRPTLRTRIIKTLVSIARPIKNLFPERLRQTLRSDDYEAVKDDELRELYLDVVKDDQSSLLPLVTIPVALLWGQNDDAAPVWIATELQQKLPLATLDVLPQAGHNLHHEKPQLVAAKLQKYVA